MVNIQSASQRELELELVRVRAEARAARLEAQAAELELMLRRMTPELHREELHRDVLTHDEVQRHDAHAQVHPPLGLSTSSSQQTSIGLSGWEQRLQSMQARKQLASAPATEPLSPGPAINWSTGSIDLAQLLSATSPASHTPLNLATDQSHRFTDMPAVVSGSLASVESPIASHPQSNLLAATASELVGTHQVDTHDVAANDERVNVVGTCDVSDAVDALPIVHRDVTGAAQQRPKEAKRDTQQPLIRIDAAHSTPSPKLLGVPAVAPELAEVAAAAAQVASDQDEEPPTRWRPASWMLSTVAHVVVIVVLASMSLAVAPPKDQLAFSGSSGDSDEAVIENFQIETSEPLQPSEPTEAEAAYDVSELGTMPITEVNVDLPSTLVTPDTEMFSDLTSSSSPSSSMMKTLKGEAGPKMQFCGVDGGGNHFAYLVDSSNSMGSGFQSARAELLASIDQLKPEQRFYVVFFDEQPDFMRVVDPNQDDESSVMATPENKKRLRAWAMNVEMNKGKAPYEVLPFVMKLRPDVIFLLSDGEFPDKIGQILREQNRQENLFGDSGPISIVHTIRYHGREGEEGRRAEATMVTIAKENSGQYRHVPKPKSN